MGAIFLIVFRESLEAAIVVGIILAFLKRAGLGRLKAAIWAGGAAGIAASLGAAAVFLAVLGEFKGRAEQLFEASVMILGASLLTMLILWIDRGDMRASIEGRAASVTGKGAWRRIALLVFVSLLREGVETVIFLGASLRDSGPAGVLAGFAGLASAVVLGFLVFAAGAKLKLRRFFAATNALLILFAAGLVGRAAGELGEAGFLPPLIEKLWNLNPPVIGGVYPLFHEEGAIGSLLKGLFGYNASPSLTMAIAYSLYLAGVGAVLFLRRRATRNR